MIRLGPDLRRRRSPRWTRRAEPARDTPEWSSLSGGRRSRAPQPSPERSTASGEGRSCRSRTTPRYPLPWDDCSSTVTYLCAVRPLLPTDDFVRYDNGQGTRGDGREARTAGPGTAHGPVTASAAESAERARPDLQLSRKGRPPRNSVDTTLLLLVTVVAATFGPYLVGGVRAALLLVYPAAVPPSFSPLSVCRPIFLRPVLLAWLLLVLAVLVSTVTQTGNIDRSFVPARGIITGLDTVLFPLAIVLLVNMARPGSAARALHGVLTTI